MPARFQSQAQVQRPLQNEVAALVKLVNGDLLEAAAKVLLHQVQVRSGNEQAVAQETPRHLLQTLEARREEFETICDQIYYTLEQSRRILVLDQKVQQQQQKSQQLQQDQNQSMDQQEQNGADELMSEGNGVPEEAVATSLDENNNDSASATAPPGEDVDIEELVQVQKERLERLRRVIILGEDADKVKQEGEGRTDGDGDYLF
ncbi:hypothetical protein NQZ79_g7916 [Umbelopsis isabellina]|nr:hypothetical protein NQZ79_g7916 [Umbelopsis isabellina]